MKTLEITINLVVRVDDETAENMTTTPGFITIDGVTLGEEALKVGFINEHEVEPLDMEIKAEEVSPERLASLVEG